MPSESTNNATRRGWRELGFFYDRDDQAKVWKLSGSRAGLLRFRDILLSYVADPRNQLKSEHAHYGPYGYLEVMTWPEAGFDNHAIRGPVADLARLANMVEDSLATVHPGSSVRIREEFAPNSEYALVLELQQDGFDPAAADSLLPAEETEKSTATMKIPSFHDGHFDGLRISPNKLVYLFLRTQEGQLFTLALHGVDALLFSEIKQGNIIFDLILRSAQLLTLSDMSELYGAAVDSTQATNLLKAKCEQGLQLLEVNASYGAQGLAIFQTFEIRPSTPD